MDGNLSWKIDDNRIGVLTMDLSGHTVNMITDLLPSFQNWITLIENERNLRGIILTSAKRDFAVGGNLESIFQLNSEEEAANRVERFKTFLRRLETLPVPVVAALNGSTLGGGYELALACNHRIAVNHPKIKIGLPEVKFGLFPGGGGTIRLPRLIGFNKAIPLLTRGTLLSPSEALQEGLIDETVNSNHEMLERAEQWIVSNPSPQQPWDASDFKEKYQESACETSEKRAEGEGFACEQILSSLYQGRSLDFDEASKAESQHFARTVISEEAKHKIKTLWFDRKKSKTSS